MQVHTSGNQTQNISLQTGPDQCGIESHFAGQQPTVSGNMFYNSKKGKQCTKRSFSCRDRKVLVPLYMKEVRPHLKQVV